MALERRTNSGTENSNDEHDSLSKRRRVENSSSRPAAAKLSSSLLPQPVPSRSIDTNEEHFEPNQESNGVHHTCEETELEICPECYQFKFEYMGDEEVIVVAGVHSFNFKLELSWDVCHWLMERAPRLKLITLPNSKNFDLLTRSFIFESQELGPGSGYPVEIKFRSTHKYVTKY